MISFFSKNIYTRKQWLRTRKGVLSRNGVNKKVAQNGNFICCFQSHGQWYLSWLSFFWQNYSRIFGKPEAPDWFIFLSLFPLLSAFHLLILLMYIMKNGIEKLWIKKKDCSTNKLHVRKQFYSFLPNIWCALNILPASLSGNFHSILLICRIKEIRSTMVVQYLNFKILNNQQSILIKYFWLSWNLLGSWHIKKNKASDTLFINPCSSD